jgi:hypothetical protein
MAASLDHAFHSIRARTTADSGVEDGTFRLAYELRDSPHVEAADRNALAENLTCQMTAGWRSLKNWPP